MGRVLNKQEEQKREELYYNGLSDHKIAFICKCCQQTITRWRERRGMPKNHPAGRKKVVYNILS
jgi:hypothetical protein